MLFLTEAFFSGCISKVINDGKDYSWFKIKSALNDRPDSNISVKICRIIEKTLNTVTNNRYKDSDDLYDAMEKIFNEFKSHGNTLESVRCGLNVLGTDISNQRCEGFLEKFYEGIRRDDDLYKQVIMDLQQEGIKISQEEFQNLNEKLDNLTEIVSREYDEKNNIPKREPVKCRTREYADKWNQNMFLNNFDEWDENAGVNVKLSDVYIDRHLPHFKYGHNENESDNLDSLLSKYIMKNNENGMLLILGQPGIGKSTLITWITANFNERMDDILVYRFASDLGNTDWKNGRISDRILEDLELNHNDLNGKILILDGFDEISVEPDRRRDILDSLYDNWIYDKTIDKFSLIITCRENYVPEFVILKCKYITLRPWNENQIMSFCNIYGEKKKNSVSESTMEKLCKNKEILGIPLILYMVLALNISIEKEESIVDVYDKIFSLKGGIYDRCINNKNFADKHRIGDVKKCIHQISREIAIWMFENEADKACIPRREYQKICKNIIQEKGEDKGAGLDFLIGNFFKLKHCEGVETEELYFVHRSIYEYFVAETIYSSIKNAMKKLTGQSREELAGNIAVYLKQGIISNTIGGYLKYKIKKFCMTELQNKERKGFYQWWESAVGEMMDCGMFYYTGENVQNYRNIIEKEIYCFVNLLKILRLLKDMSKQEYLMMSIDKVKLEKYIRLRLIQIEETSFYGTENINLSKMHLENINLSGAGLRGVNLAKSNFKGADLSRTDLSNANLNGADLSDANLNGADLSDANLSYANLSGANLSGANLNYANLSYANLRGLDLQDTDLKYANLKGADINETKMKRENTYGTNFAQTAISNPNAGIIYK